MRRLGSDDEQSVIDDGTRLIRPIGSNGFSIGYRPSWIAIPVESGAHFAQQDIDRLLVAARQTEDDELDLIDFGVPDRPNVRAYRLRSDQNDLRGVNEAFALRDILLLARSRRWAVFASEADFFIALGPEDSAVRIAGAPPEEALRAFHTYAASWLQDVPAPLRAVADTPWSS
jgi:hypothetical protein